MHSSGHHPAYLQVAEKSHSPQVSALHWSFVENHISQETIRSSECNKKHVTVVVASLVWTLKTSSCRYVSWTTKHVNNCRTSKQNSSSIQTPGSSDMITITYTRSTPSEIRSPPSTHLAHGDFFLPTSETTVGKWTEEKVWLCKVLYLAGIVVGLVNLGAIASCSANI